MCDNWCSAVIRLIVLTVDRFVASCTLSLVTPTGTLALNMCGNSEAGSSCGSLYCGLSVDVSTIVWGRGAALV